MFGYDMNNFFARHSDVEWESLLLLYAPKAASTKENDTMRLPEELLVEPSRLEGGETTFLRTILNGTRQINRAASSADMKQNCSKRSELRTILRDQIEKRKNGTWGVKVEAQIKRQTSPAKTKGTGIDKSLSSKASNEVFEAKAPASDSESAGCGIAPSPVMRGTTKSRDEQNAAGESLVIGRAHTRQQREGTTLPEGTTSTVMTDATPSTLDPAAVTHGSAGSAQSVDPSAALRSRVSSITGVGTPECSPLNLCVLVLSSKKLPLDEQSASALDIIAPDGESENVPGCAFKMQDKTDKNDANERKDEGYGDESKENTMSVSSTIRGSVSSVVESRELSSSSCDVSNVTTDFDDTEYVFSSLKSPPKGQDSTSADERLLLCGEPATPPKAAHEKPSAGSEKHGGDPTGATAVTNRKQQINTSGETRPFVCSAEPEAFAVGKDQPSKSNGQSSTAHMRTVSSTDSNSNSANDVPQRHQACALSDAKDELRNTFEAFADLDDRIANSPGDIVILLNESAQIKGLHGSKKKSTKRTALHEMHLDRLQLCKCLLNLGNGSLQIESEDAYPKETPASNADSAASSRATPDIPQMAHASTLRADGAQPRAATEPVADGPEATGGGGDSDSGRRGGGSGECYLISTDADLDWRGPPGKLIGVNTLVGMQRVKDVCQAVVISGAMVCHVGQKLECGCVVGEKSAPILEAALEQCVRDGQFLEFCAHQEFYVHHDCDHTMELVRHARDEVDDTAGERTMAGESVAEELNNRAFVHRLRQISPPHHFLGLPHRNGDAIDVALRKGMLKMTVGEIEMTPFQLFLDRYLAEGVLSNLAGLCDLYANLRSYSRIFRFWTSITTHEMKLFILQMIHYAYDGRKYRTGKTERSSLGTAAVPPSGGDTEAAGSVLPDDPPTRQHSARTSYCMSRERFAAIAASWRVFDWWQRPLSDALPMHEILATMCDQGNAVEVAPTLLSASVVQVPCHAEPVSLRRRHDGERRPRRAHHSSLAVLMDSRLFCHAITLTRDERRQRCHPVPGAMLELCTLLADEVQARNRPIFYVDGMTMEQAESWVQDGRDFVAPITPGDERHRSFLDFSRTRRHRQAEDGSSTAVAYGVNDRSCFFWRREADEKLQVIASTAHLLDERGGREAAQLAESTHRALQTAAGDLQRLDGSCHPQLRYYHTVFLYAISAVMRNAILTVALVRDVDLDSSPEFLDAYCEDQMHQMMCDLEEYCERQPLQRMDARARSSRRRPAAKTLAQDSNTSEGVAAAIAATAAEQRALMDEMKSERTGTRD